eukprot:m.768691 g.768691  ORF g.768691 m.768691 type:complete len:954 (-) comp23231_c0_seq1:2234-5095(-)
MDNIKWRRALLKKLRGVELCKVNRSQGVPLNELQLAKLKTEPELLEQLKRAGADASMVTAARVEAREGFRSPAVKAKAASERAHKKRRISTQPTKEVTSEKEDVAKIEKVAAPNKEVLESKPWSKKDPNSDPSDAWEKVSNAKTVAAITALLTTHQRTGALLAHAVHTIAKKKLLTSATIESNNTATNTAQILRHCASKAVTLGGRECSKVFWAVGKISANAVDADGIDDENASSSQIQVEVGGNRIIVKQAVLSLLHSLEAIIVQQNRLKRFDAQGAVTLLHAYATLQHRPPEALLRPLLDRLCELAAELTGQDASSTWWGLGKLRIGTHDSAQKLLPLLEAQTKEIIEKGDFKPQELSMTWWAMATLDHAPKSLVACLRKESVKKLSKGTPQSIANTSWAVAKLIQSESDKIDDSDMARENKSLSEAIGRAAIASAADFSLRGLSTTVWACARLGLDDALQELLTTCIDRVEESISGGDVGNIAWAVAASKVKSTKILKALAHRISHCVDTLDWQAIAHVQYLNRASEQKLAKLYVKATAKHADEASVGQKKKKGVNFHRVMNAVGAAAIKSVCDRAASLRGTQLDQAFVSIAPWTTDTEHFAAPSEASSIVLVVDMVVAETENMLTKEGHDVKHWCRFSTRERVHDGKIVAGGRALPPAEFLKSDDVRAMAHACLARLPPSRAAAEMMIAGVVACLSPVGSMWLSGTVGDGIFSAIRVLRDKFQHTDIVHSSDTYVIVRASLLQASVAAQLSGDARMKLSTWRIKTQLAVEGAHIPWVSYPGLFAGGTLDIMTKALLDALPVPRANARVLDYCCGSGVIAHVLLKRVPSVAMTVSDADALAIKAVKDNLGASVQACLLENGLKKMLKRGDRYDWIVSNPPVHTGLDNDFAVIAELLHAGPQLLHDAGTIYFVAQTYIPMESFELHAACTLSELWTDGRFSVWQCSKQSQA